MAAELPPFLLLPAGGTGTGARPRPIKRSFLDAGIVRLFSLLKRAFLQTQWAGRKGLLQSTDSRVKLGFLLLFVVLISLKKAPVPELGITLFLFCLCLASRIDVISFYARILLIGFFFGFLMALPGAFNVIVPGKVIVPLLTFESTHGFLGHALPRTVGITEEGLSLLFLITLRVLNSVTVSFLVMSTTPFAELVRALRLLRVSESFLLTITLSYKYILIFLRTAEEMFLAGKSRIAGPMGGVEGRRWASDRLSLLFGKAYTAYEGVCRAMEARGFHGTVILAGPRAAGRWAPALILLGGGVFFLWL